MAAKINKALNIVLVIDSESRGKIYVYSIPISREIYEAHFEVLSLVHSKLWENGANYALLESQRIAYLMLKKAAKEIGASKQNPEGAWPDIQREFLGEIVRLTTVGVPGDHGYDQLPLHTAMERGLLDEEDREEVESALVFFTLEKLSRRRAQMQGMWSGAITSLSFTEFLNSLPTSTLADSSGAPPAQPVPEPPRLASVPR
jgi:hypothetical protein